MAIICLCLLELSLRLVLATLPLTVKINGIYDISALTPKNARKGFSFDLSSIGCLSLHIKSPKYQTSESVCFFFKMAAKPLK